MQKNKFTVFFSWQSDIKGNRKIIKDSILAGCQIQKEKNGYEVEFDESTRNLPGSPSIEEAVLRKISKADIVVCDITPIGTSGQKQMPNSNVVFELGFAMHALGEEHIILVAKKGDWDVKDLPFDFNHRRIGMFISAKDCDLNFEIDCCIKHCRKNKFLTIKWQQIPLSRRQKSPLCSLQEEWPQLSPACVEWQSSLTSGKSSDVFLYCCNPR